MAMLWPILVIIAVLGVVLPGGGMVAGEQAGLSRAPPRASRVIRTRRLRSWAPNSPGSPEGSKCGVV